IPAHSLELDYNHGGPFGAYINATMQNKWLGYAATLLLGFFNSVIINSLFVERESSPRSSHLPAALFLILSGVASQPEYMLQNQLLVVFVLVALFFVQKLEFAVSEVSDTFFAGFFIALATTITPFAVALIVFVLLRVGNTRWGFLRVLFLLIVGFIVPLYLIWTINFLFNNGNVFIESYTQLYSFSFIGISSKLTDQITLIFFGLIGLISIFSTLNSSAYKNVNPRGWLQLWMLFAGTYLIVGLFIKGQNGAFQLAITPVAGFVSFTILGEKRKLLRKLVFYLIFITMLIDHANTMGLIGQ
ncbi:MAG: DUF6427 family protein, partial [Bacteroidia bacterium]